MTINWGMVSDGGVFESLVQALLYLEDAGTILFGRPGKDSAQDARSADGSVVFQSKYRTEGGMDEVIKIAKEEFAHVSSYRDPSHSNYKHWKDACKWILISNIRINPNDDAKWRAAVVPMFAAIGLNAEYWSRDDLDRKLEQHPEIRDVFFEGENRVLVGLSEAYSLLSTELEVSGGLETPFVNRVQEMATFRIFGASEKRILPVIGPNGIGKSRLVYEAALTLADEGWRVFWGLPNSMLISSKWFRLLNGTQKTIVVLDNPTDPKLIQTVIEQLAATERKSWKVLVTSQSSIAETVRRLRDSKLTFKAIELGELTEAESKQLIQSWMEGIPDPAWVHSIFRLTTGIPGWVNLLGALYAKGKLDTLPETASEITRRYIEASLEVLPNELHDQAMDLLRWLAIWETLTLDSQFAERPEFEFLATRGVPAAIARRIMESLNSTGLVHCWGVDRRIYGIRQRLVRVELLASWLLEENNGKLKASLDGKNLVGQLINGEMPNLESILHSLAVLSRSRLDEAESTIFLKPVFDELQSLTNEGDARTLDGIIDLIEKGGAADPEGSLDILQGIRKSRAQPVEIETIFGPHAYDKTSLIQQLPWVLFELGMHVSTSLVANRFLTEFYELSAMRETDEDWLGGKRPRDLIKRLLRDSNNSGVFYQPAYELAKSWIDQIEKWPFVGWILECLSYPVRESVDWIATGTVSFRRQAVAPGGPEWNFLAKVRSDIFRSLRSCSNDKLRRLLWTTLSTIHHDLNRAAIQGNVVGTDIDAYRAILETDFVEMHEVLSNPPATPSIEEGTAARTIWEWYLEYGESGKRKELAAKCEDIYRKLAKWPVQEFFAFSNQDQLEPVTKAVAEAMFSAKDPSEIWQFFREAESYLSVARLGRRDGADERLSDLADTCIAQFNPTGTNPNVITRFIQDTISGKLEELSLAQDFCIKVCKRYIGRVKKESKTSVNEAITDLINVSQNPTKLLTSIYFDPHPKVIGPLTESELRLILDRENEISSRTLATLMAGLSLVNGQSTREVMNRLFDRLDKKCPDPSETMKAFIGALTFAWTRHDTSDATEVQWIFDSITELGLDGSLVESHELQRLRDKCQFHLKLPSFLNFVESRLAIDQSGPPYREFQIIPFDFNASEWCIFDMQDPEACEAFDVLCSKVFVGGFVTTSLIPKYLSQLDIEGIAVSKFIEKQIASGAIEFDQLRLLAFLAAGFQTGTNAWRACATPICMQASRMTRVERERLFRNLTNHETKAYVSTIGGVASQYIDDCRRSKSLMEAEPVNSPLRPYFEWAEEVASDVLNREIQSAEEDLHGQS